MSVIQISARVAASFMLGQVLLDPKQNEPQYIRKIRYLLRQVIQAIGSSDDLRALVVETIQPSVHALVALLADTVTGVKREDTKQYLVALAVPQRVAVERLALKLTGQEGENRRWNDELWSLRTYLREITAASPSGVTMADIRNGYDESLHAVIDALFERWEILVS